MVIGQWTSRVATQIFTVLLCACYAAHGLSQTCDEIIDRAHSAAMTNDYYTALGQYMKARNCYLETGEHGDYLTACAYVLDCLDKTLQNEALQSELAGFSDAVEQLKGRLPASRYESMRLSALQFRAILLNNRGDTRGASALFSKALDSLEAIPKLQRTLDDDIRQFKLLVYAGRQYVEQGNYSKATDAAYKALEIFGKHPEPFLEDGSAILPNELLATCYTRQDDHVWAIRHLNAILEVLPSIDQRTTERRISTYLALGERYLAASNFDSAAHYNSLAQAFDKQRRFIFETEFQAGMISFQQGDLRQAESHFGYAHKTVATAGDQLAARTNRMLGEVALARGDLDRALKHFQSALNALSEGSDIQNPLKNSSVDSFFIDTDVLAILSAKSRCFLEKSGRGDQGDYLDAAWSACRVGVDFIEHLRNGYLAESDRMSLISNSYELFAAALNTCVRQLSFKEETSWIDTAFMVMEKSKALNLLDAVVHDRAREFAGIPDTLIQRETRIKSAIERTRRLLEETNQNSNAADSLIIALQSNLRDLKREHTQLITFYELNFPQYHELRYNRGVLNTKMVQSKLNNNQQFIEYFVHGNAIYCIKLDRDNKYFRKIETGSDITQLVHDLHIAMDHFVSTKSRSAVDQYSSIAAELYGTLLKPVDPVAESLIIVPDGPLNFLSFAGLLTGSPGEEKDLRRFPYLANICDITYANSARVYLQLASRNGIESRKVLAIVPPFRPDGAMTSLKYPRQESDDLIELFGGEIIRGDKCSTSNVKSILNDDGPYNIVHFATHGVADGVMDGEITLYLNGEPELQTLTSSDLYGMSFPTNLVYLSACETGRGELIGGEGVLNLARAFFYAGSRSLVTTLWPVDDKRSAVIAGKFYSNLKSGMNKAEALASAQRAYIRDLTSENRLYAHPVYWAGIIHTGVTEPVAKPMDRDKTWQWILPAALVLLAFGWLMWNFSFAKR